ncbi:hypothetical protein BJY04DRAFT_36169 [Aspergillus karnatakaensis]|uniref:uncharacterized protein n=1 Tax=Aspergillus karnatakaensis TaxID=1810916 RepID=UPI003CCCD050
MLDTKKNPKSQFVINSKDSSVICYTATEKEEEEKRQHQRQQQNPDARPSWRSTTCSRHIGTFTLWRFSNLHNIAANETLVLACCGCSWHSHPRTRRALGVSKQHDSTPWSTDGSSKRPYDLGYPNRRSKSPPSIVEQSSVLCDAAARAMMTAGMRKLIPICVKVLSSSP